MISRAASGGELVALEGDRARWRVRLGADALPVLARADDGLWTAVGSALRGGYRLVRIDPETGRRTASVDLGAHRPVAPAASGDTVAVMAASGAVVFVESGR